MFPLSQWNTHKQRHELWGLTPPCRQTDLCNKHPETVTAAMLPVCTQEKRDVQDRMAARAEEQGTSLDGELGLSQTEVGIAPSALAITTFTHLIHLCLCKSM